jgi:hypothetical protein
MNIRSKQTLFSMSAIATATLGFCSATAFAATMTKTDYNAAKDRITAEYATDKKTCARLSGNAKDICREQAKAKEKVTRAEVEFGYTGKAADAKKVAMVKADTSFAVAKEMCDDKAGNAKDVCREEAKAIHTKAVADSKMMTTVSDAKADAVETKNDADYKVAVEKCDALAGDAKTACVNAAKARFVKT